MTSTPILSIVIPTLNRAYCLPRAIESALAQTFANIEIIVSDNGSVDKTQEIIARYNDPRLRFFHRTETISAAMHGNFLIEQSRGKYFLGLSDDDYLEPEFASRVLDLFERYPELSFAYSGCWIHYADVPVPTLVGPSVESGTDFILAHYLNVRNICWCACVTRVEYLRRIGPIPEGQIFGDMYYWTKMAFMGKVGCISEPLSNYIFMSDNLSSGTSVPDWAGEAEAIAAEVFTRYCEVVSEPSLRRLMRDGMNRYLAISVGNQFAWNALRNRPRAQLLSWLPTMLRYFVCSPRVFMQVVGFLLLPRSYLRARVLNRARGDRLWRLEKFTSIVSSRP
jgi:glycosyltransferase involved in cell wall biosynthesis